jgi:hypothetical protein
VAAFTQSEIDDLIRCPKRIVEAPRRDMKQEGAYLRKSAKLVASTDGIGDFSIFIRKNEEDVPSIVES